MIASKRMTKTYGIQRQRKLTRHLGRSHVISNSDDKKFLKCDETNRGSSTSNTKVNSFPLENTTTLSCTSQLSNKKKKKIKICTPHIIIDNKQKKKKKTQDLLININTEIRSRKHLIAYLNFLTDVYCIKV